MNIVVSPELARFLIDCSQHLFGIFLLLLVVGRITKRKKRHSTHVGTAPEARQNMNNWVY
jgi:hypothetical protein